MNVTKILTEKQLSKIFKRTRKKDDNACLHDLNQHSEASVDRLNEVEIIADNNLLSAGQQAANQLAHWSEATGHDIERKLNSNQSFILLTWLKPGLVAASFVTTFLFLNPDVNKETQTQQIGDQIMFNSSFENSHTTQDTIIDASFDSSPNKDVISNINF